MITEDMMTTTEMILMSYFFNIDDWLVGQKTIIPEITQKTKNELSEVLKHDFETLEVDEPTEYSKELSESILVLDSITEQNFQQMKMDILSWETNIQSSKNE